MFSYDIVFSSLSKFRGQHSGNDLPSDPVLPISVSIDTPQRKPFVVEVTHSYIELTFFLFFLEGINKELCFKPQLFTLFNFLFFLEKQTSFIIKLYVDREFLK